MAAKGSAFTAGGMVSTVHIRARPLSGSWAHSSPITVWSEQI